MRLKRTRSILLMITIISLCGLIYLSTDLPVFTSQKAPTKEKNEDDTHIVNKIHEEPEAQKIQNNIDNSNEVIRNIPNFNDFKNSDAQLSEMIYSDTCPIEIHYAPRTNIQMLEMYHNLEFDNPDGGAWKQGWRIEVDDNMWNKQHKLKVFVIPHSHNDPGWIYTFEDYYNSQTKHILNNMVEKLPEDPRRKFIWAEISFFSLWWDEIEPQKKVIVKKLIKNNQLEIVTGGWVMNDEANSHWISIVQQLTEGHQWLHKHLNYTPSSGWSIDPFGMSATQPMIQKQVGLKNMLIQRVHYSVKKQLARDQNLEFYWRQSWDGQGKTDLFTHMMPFYSYDIPHTCGPDPKICCQFDFKRLPSHGLSCPWRVPPQIITDTNVAARAALLLDQYRKKSKLYKTNILLVPLGDDFRYDHSSEWDLQYNNYQKLFDYMNSNINLHVQAQFGTLSDYFKALHAEKKEFPTLSGDFFTYADRDDNYWSGYYTSRPFYKRMDRILLNYIRSSEIILTLAHISNKPGSKWIANIDGDLHKSLSSARRALSLFQHHDGITGTAKDPVVDDYGQKLMDAILNCQNVLQKCTNLLLSGPGGDNENSDTVFYNVDDVRQTQDALPEQYTITIGPELSTKRVVIFNSLPYKREEVVTFILSTPFIEVTGAKGKRIPCQVSPIFEHVVSMANSKYRVSFIVNIPALSLTSYIINALSENDIPNESFLSKVKVYNHYSDIYTPKGFSNIEVSPSANEFTIQNERITASFNNLGLLKAIRVGNKIYPVHLDFAKYGARKARETSGPYLFLPNGNAVPLTITNTVVKVIEGPILSSVTVQLPYIQHTVTLYNTKGGDSLGLEIENTVDILDTNNFEIVMRLSTNINSTDKFYTDLNGFQILKRKRFKKLPLQGNYYPVPTVAYIEDAHTRLSLLTASPLGGSSLQSGQLEIMLDRRLMQDDFRGAGQGVTDNHPTRHMFRLIFENKSPNCQTQAETHPSGFNTLSAHIASETLLNPLMRLLRTDDDDTTSQESYTSVSTEFGVDITLPIFKTGININNKEYVGLVLHRKYLNLCYSNNIQGDFKLSIGNVNLNGILPPSATNLKLNKASLSFLEIQDSLDVRSNIEMCPMDIQAFLLHR